MQVSIPGRKGCFASQPKIIKVSGYAPRRARRGRSRRGSVTRVIHNSMERTFCDSQWQGSCSTLEHARAWNLERPPDCKTDFNGDKETWNVARDVWYKAATGKVLPAASEAEDREKQWQLALTARRQRRKRAAQSEAQAEKRRDNQVQCMRNLRAANFEAELKAIMAQLKDRTTAIVLDDPVMIARTSSYQSYLVRPLHASVI